MLYCCNPCVASAKEISKGSYLWWRGISEETILSCAVMKLFFPRGPHHFSSEIPNYVMLWQRSDDLVKLQTALPFPTGIVSYFRIFTGNQLSALSAGLSCRLQSDFKLLLPSCSQNKGKLLSAEILYLSLLILWKHWQSGSFGVGQSHKHFLLNLCFSAEQAFILYVYNKMENLY